MTANEFKPFCSNQELDEIHLIKPCVAEQLNRTRGRCQLNRAMRTISGTLVATPFFGF